MLHQVLIDIEYPPQQHLQPFESDRKTHTHKHKSSKKQNEERFHKFHVH